MDYIKRVIGLPGERGGGARRAYAYVNGETLDEPYVKASYRNQENDSAPQRVEPASHYFMMGDHRNKSSDSRSWGQVPATWSRGAPS